MNTRKRETGRLNPAVNVAEMSKQADKAETLLKAMASTPRLMVLCYLTEGEKAVGELLDEIPLSPSALSQHLAILREQELVTARRQGQAIYYTLNEGPALDIIGVLYTTFCKTRRSRRSRRKA